MGDPAGLHAAQARLWWDLRLTKRRILKDIGPLRFGEGHDTTFPYALAVAAKADYDWLMGSSGAAFTATIDEAGWDPLAATPRDSETLTRAARAAGVRLDPEPPPYDDVMRELVLDRVIEAVDAHLPPLVFGLGGAPEYGLLIGYDVEGPTFFARTFFDKGDDPRREDWSAFESEGRGGLIFLDKGSPPDRPSAVREGIDAALAAGDASDRALASWSAALRDDARWSDAKHAGAAAFADHAMRAVLADKRRAAARFLRSARVLFPNAPGADLLRAAESYGYAADAAAKGGIGGFDAGVAMRFIDVGHRRAWAKNLDVVREHDAEARGALASARDGMR
ncbi:MAG TPA: hypothetical protein VGR87_13725 [Candidatus Limnocylindria bacterium]|nr:hypothetical protein [Candidatus Limnocylindria bacterium]